MDHLSEEAVDPEGDRERARELEDLVLVAKRLPDRARWGPIGARWGPIGQLVTLVRIAHRLELALIANHLFDQTLLRVAQLRAVRSGLHL